MVTGVIIFDGGSHFSGIGFLEHIVVVASIDGYGGSGLVAVIFTDD